MDHKRAALFKELEKGYGSEVGDEADGHTAFLALAARCKSDDGLSWSHFLSTIGRKFLPRVCQAVAHHAAAALGDGESTVEAINSLSQGVEVSESGTDARLRLQVLTAVTEFAAAFLSSSKLPAPDALLQTVGALHSILLMLHGTEAEGLQAAIAAVCEQWWLQEKPGREAVITQLLPYLLVKSLEESARPRDVRRVWGMREALLILDFEDDSIESLTELLLRCFLHPLYALCCDACVVVVQLSSLLLFGYQVSAFPWRGSPFSGVLVWSAPGCDRRHPPDGEEPATVHQGSC